MNEGIKAFLDRLTEDAELQSKFSGASTPEEAYELAKSVGGGFTMEEFMEAARAIGEAEDGDISDEALASVAGGTDAEAGADTDTGIVRPAEVPSLSIICGLSRGDEGKATAKFREICRWKPDDK